MQMTDRAKTVDETYRVCNPEKPLQPDDDWYVDLTESRGVKQIAKSITRNIARSERDSQIKLLFTGHRGSGKTTELLRLQNELEVNNYFTIYMDVEELLDLGELNYLDVLVTIAKQVQVGLYDRKISLSDDLLDSIANWFAERIAEETKSTELQGCVGTEAEAGSKIPYFFKLFARVTANLKTGSRRQSELTCAVS
jgi:signal recognition particle GTPase